MKDENKTKAQLLAELQKLRRYIKNQNGSAGIDSNTISRDRRNRFCALFEHFPCGMLVEDDDRKIIEVNKNLCEIFGIDAPPESLSGTAMDVFIQQMTSLIENSSQFLNRTKDIISAGKHVQAEKIFLSDGRILGRNYLRIDSSSAPVEHVWYYRDITDQHNAEQKLKISEERLELAVEGTELGLWDWNVQTGEVFFNDHWAHILGYSSDEIKPHVSAWENLLHPEDKSRVMEMLNKHLKGETPNYETEHRLRTKNGDWIWILDRGRVLERDESGVPLRAVGSHINITERKKAEHLIEENEQRLRALVNSTPDVICFKDGKGRWLEANEADLKLFALEGVNYFGKTDSELADFTLPLYREAFRTCATSDEQTWQNGTLTRATEVIPTVEGESRIFDVIKVPLFQPDGSRKGLVVLGRDVTEHNKVEQLLKETNKSLKESTQNLQMLVESVDVIPWHFNYKENRFSFIGKQVERILGTKPETWTDMDSWARHIHPADRENTVKSCLYSTEKGQNHTLEYRCVTPENKIVWIRDIIAVHCDHNNKPVELVGYMIDISSIKQREEGIATNLKQTEILQRNIELLNRAQTSKEVCDAAAKGILELLQCDRSSILLYETDTIAHFKAWQNLSPEYRQAVDGHCPWDINDIDAQPLCYPDVKSADLEKHIIETILQEGINAVMFVPLKGTAQLLGKFMVYFNSNHQFTEQELNLTQVFSQNLSAVLQRFQALDAAQNAAHKYSTIFNDIAEGVYQSTGDGHFITVNPAMVHMFGYRNAEEMLQIKNTKALYWDETERQRLITLANQNETLTHVEVKMRRADGEPLWVLMNDRVVKDKDGNTLYFQGTLSNITERRKMEEALRNSEKRYRNFFERDITGNYLSTPQGKLLDCNPTFVRMLGYDSAEEIKGISTQELYPTTTERSDFLDELHKNKKLSNFEFKMIRKDGKTIHCVENVFGLFDENGELTHFQGYIFDETERKFAEQLLETQRDLGVALSSAKDLTETLQLSLGTAIEISSTDGGGIYLVDGSTGGLHLAFHQGLPGAFVEQVTYFGPETPNTQVVMKGEAIYTQYKELTNQLNIERRYPFKASAIIPIKYQNRVIGAFNIASQTLNNLPEQSRTALETIATQVSEVIVRYQAEEEKARLEEQLRRSQKLETIGTLAGGIAHDFNNILAPILGYADMALLNLQPDNPMYDYLRQILKSAFRAKELVEQILLFAKQSEKERHPLALQPLINESLKLLRPTIPATIEIRHHIDPKCEKVLADPSQIHQAIVNLCTNAFHAMQISGGTLTINLNQITIDEASSLHHANLPVGKYARLSVIDTGHGMDKSTLNRIFEPFFTTKSVDKGTGLGLSVVHGIVQSHGGNVEVESELERGSKFHVYLPIAKDATLKNSTSTQSVVGGKESILIVDDDDAVATIVAKMLKTLGYVVEFRTSSEAALQAFRSEPNKYDLLISDLTMPDMTGLDLAQQVLQVQPGLPVMIMTGYGDNLTENTRKKFGIKQVLGKPIMMSDLASAVREILD